MNSLVVMARHDAVVSKAIVRQFQTPRFKTSCSQLGRNVQFPVFVILTLYTQEVVVKSPFSVFGMAEPLEVAVQLQIRTTYV